jgi:hypothetical protein
MEDGINFGVLESLFCMNESLHKAGLYLEALSRDENFDRDKVGRYLDRIKLVRAATNSYVMGVIQKVESEVGVSA